jgi:hypothetical protein
LATVEALRSARFTPCSQPIGNDQHLRWLDSS